MILSHVYEAVKFVFQFLKYNAVLLFIYVLFVLKYSTFQSFLNNAYSMKLFQSVYVDFYDQNLKYSTVLCDLLLQLVYSQNRNLRNCCTVQKTKYEVHNTPLRL